MPLTRYYSKYKKRPFSMYNPFSGGLFSEISGLHTEVVSLEKAFLVCDTPVLYILPDKENAYPNQKVLYSTPDTRVKKYLSKRGTATVEYKGKRIDVYPMSLWFNVTCGYHLKESIQALRILQSQIEKIFQPSNKEEYFSIPLLATPAQCGIDILKRSLPFNQEYPRLPENIESILLENNTQGHMEVFQHQGKTVIDELHCYDGRWMYSSCLRHIPVGPIQHDEVEEVAYTSPSKTGSKGVIPGFYRVTATVPSTWEHIGILPCVGNGKPSYPNKPGNMFTTWVTSPELVLALKHGWDIQIHERILWPKTYELPEMLKVWSEKLIKAREELTKGMDEPVKGMLRDAYRSVLLQTVGTFFRSDKEYDGYCFNSEEIPEDATGAWLEDGDIWRYTLPASLSPLQQMTCLPHVAAYIWGVARKKLHEQALKVPFQNIVAVRTDAVWTTCTVDTLDTGKVGQFREKPLKAHEGVPWPKHSGEMKKLVQELRVN